jgi:hypothetical protein
MRLLCEVGRSAECTALAAARLKASGMVIIGTARVLGKRSSFLKLIKSLRRRPLGEIADRPKPAHRSHTVRQGLPFRRAQIPAVIPLENRRSPEPWDERCDGAPEQAANWLKREAQGEDPKGCAP